MVPGKRSIERLKIQENYIESEENFLGDGLFPRKEVFYRITHDAENRI